ncbi:carboxymuconolactone decarboxylase family protein [Alkalibacillus almallahensis]|uniref:carboxymuconolactone decarboxylase family protein n=1 Tax=Alkalibacillus almallahensis TaxID=1379154 RepID=UPI001421A06B|nr:carboxymuconolactone decarboxylase family protein [Alkalibacillus almallahensis]NIK10998.1 AhpD family alkylhydroperoxidase [Alkalibacillus almallahensis]
MNHKNHENFDDVLLYVKEKTSEVEKNLPELTEQYFRFTDSAFKEGSLDEKTKQLIALSIAVYTKDHYCMVYHAKGAAEHQAEEQEVLEAIGVAIALGGGAAWSQGVTFSHDAFLHFKQQ